MHRFAITGISHKFAPVEVRELLAFPPESLPKALRMLREDFGVDQAVIISTCNRVEILTHCAHADVQAVLADFLASFHRVRHETFRPHLYTHVGESAVEHLLRVAASLDSLVLGETQILAQIKDAYALAAAEGATGKALNGLLHRAFAVAKEVHSQTAISRGRLSIASVAVDLIRRTFDDLDRRTALLVGLGEMGELTLRHLREAGVGSVIVANRTHQRALDMAKTIGGEAIPLTLLGDYLHRADIVVSQTAAPGIVISKDMVAKAMKQRGGRSLFLVDLAVPRDIHPEADQVEGVYRYEIDDLQRVVAEASEARTQEVARALELVTQARAEFVASQQVVSVEPILAAIRERAEALLAAELARANGSLSPEAAEAAREASRRFMNKLLHQPTLALKDEARRGTDAQTLAFAARLFGVDGVIAGASGESGAMPKSLPTEQQPESKSDAAPEPEWNVKLSSSREAAGVAPEVKSRGPRREPGA